MTSGPAKVLALLLFAATIILATNAYRINEEESTRYLEEGPALRNPESMIPSTLVGKRDEHFYIVHHPHDIHDDHFYVNPRPIFYFKTHALKRRSAPIRPEGAAQ
ncbi:hypothetical protein ACOMHN_015294 [Nucella lapillus]